MQSPTDATILCAVGDPHRAGLVRALRARGWRVTEAATAAEAREKRTEAPPDVLIVDAALAASAAAPGLVTSDDGRPSAPSVLVLAEDPDATSARWEGPADLWLGHPVSPTSVVSSVSLLLRTHEGLLRTDEGGGQEALRQAHELIEGIAQGTEDLIAAEDLDFRYTYCNEPYRREFEKLWGKRIELGTNMVEAMAPWPEEQRKAEALWSRALAGESFRVEMEFGPTPEEMRVYDLRFNPIRDAEGRVVGAAHIFRDVTERVRSERDLRESQERLKESDRRKDEYLAMLGHELRNPLAAIQSATDLVKQAEQIDPFMERVAAVLERQTEHMARLVDGLLEVSRIATGKIELNLRALDLREVLQDLLEDRRAALAESGLEVERRLHDGPLFVSGDPVRLTQVADNLLGNALKFTSPPGRVTLHLDEDDGSAVLRVRDTGVGIRAELLAHIFEPFQQEQQDIDRRSGGLGLGLALAKGLVELHGGTIVANSEGTGRGTEIEVRLPLVHAPAELGSRAETSPDLPARRVLIVEDHEDAAAMLRHVLERRGHRVHIADTGDAALAILKAHPIDVVVCDLGLPGMSGYEVARRVRADPSSKHLRLVALTGYGQPEDRDRTREAGFDVHLTKPVDQDALRRALE